MHPVICQYKGFTIYSYGLFIALGFLVSVALIARRAREISLERNELFDAMFLILLGGIVGGRLLFVLLEWEYFRSNLWQILRIWRGGLAVQGSLIGALLTVGVIFKRKEVSFLSAVDLMIPYAALAQSFGRIGCFLNGCCYGLVSDDLFLGVAYPAETVARIPIQIFYSLGHLAIFVILRVYQGRFPRKGRVFALYLMLFSVMRFFLDRFRGDVLSHLGSLHTTQIFALIFFLTGLVIYVFTGNAKKRQGSCP